jgi:hypothetical protein
LKNAFVLAAIFFLTLPLNSFAWDQSLQPTAVPTPLPPKITLQDGSPDADLASGGFTGPGPFFLMPKLTISNDQRALYTRPVLKITLLEGKGKITLAGERFFGAEFATPTPDPSSLKDNEWLEPTDLPALFYPEGAPGTTYHLQISCVGHPDVGVLDYHFTTSALDPAALSRIKTDMIQADKNKRVVNYSYRVQSTNLSGSPGQPMKAVPGMTMALNLTKDSLTMQTAINGKTTETTKPRPVFDYAKESGPLGDPCGETKDDYIYCWISTSSQKGKDGTVTETRIDPNYFFINKTTHETEKTILIVGNGSYSIRTETYKNFGPINLPAESTGTFYYNFKAQSIGKSITDQVQINP